MNLPFHLVERLGDECPRFGRLAPGMGEPCECQPGRAEVGCRSAPGEGVERDGKLGGGLVERARRDQGLAGPLPESCSPDFPAGPIERRRNGSGERGRAVPVGAAKRDVGVDLVREPRHPLVRSQLGGDPGGGSEGLGIDGLVGTEQIQPVEQQLRANVEEHRERRPPRDLLHRAGHLLGLVHVRQGVVPSIGVAANRGPVGQDLDDGSRRAGDPAQLVEERVELRLGLGQAAFVEVVHRLRAAMQGGGRRYGARRAASAFADHAWTAGASPRVSATRMRPS